MKTPTYGHHGQKKLLPLSVNNGHLIRLIVSHISPDLWYSFTLHVYIALFTAAVIDASSISRHPCGVKLESINFHRKSIKAS